VDGLGTRKKIPEDVAFYPHLCLRVKVGRPRRVSPTSDMPTGRADSIFSLFKFLWWIQKPEIMTKMTLIVKKTHYLTK